MNPEHFIINSDYPLEKIAGLFEYSGTTGASTEQIPAYDTFVIPNTVGVALLIDGQFSFTPDFSVAYPLCSEDSSHYFQALFTYCTSSKIEIQGAGYGGSREIYFRLWGFVPEDNPAIVAPTASQSKDEFVIDTRKNYLKVYKEERISIPAGETVSIPHDLGFEPYVKAWRGSNSQWQVIDFYRATVSLEVTASFVKFTNTSEYSVPLYYRIYANEA